MLPRMTRTARALALVLVVGGAASLAAQAAWVATHREPAELRRARERYRVRDLIARRLEQTLGYLVQRAPSFSLRGGTREVLRGIIARGLGLR